MALTLQGLGCYVGLCLFHIVRCICKRIISLIQEIYLLVPARFKEDLVALRYYESGNVA
jgi:hypothetical protein